MCALSLIQRALHICHNGWKVSLTWLVCIVFVKVVDPDPVTGVNGVERPVDGVELPVDDVERPVHSVERPVDRVECPEDDVELPVDGVE